MTTTKYFDINTPGARTLADATPYMVDGRPVAAAITGNTITIFVGDSVRHTAPLPKGVGHNIASVADYVIDILTNPEAVQVGVIRDNADTIRVTVRANNNLSAKNFGRKASAAARRTAGGRRIVRVWTGGANFPKRGEQVHCYTYAVIND